jgi:hypothetical protein
MVQRSFVRLNSALLARLNEHPLGWPSRIQFCHFCRHVQKYKGLFDRQYAALRAGQGVDFIVAKGFVEYLQRDAWGWPEVTMANGTEPAQSLGGREDYDEGVWKNLGSLFSSINEQFRGPDEMNLHNPTADCLRIAKMVIYRVGYIVAQGNDPLDEKSCIGRGQLHMQRTVEEYAQWLLAMWRKDPRTVKFAVVPRGKGSEQEYARVGASVSIPLSEHAYASFCEGEVSDIDLEPKDITRSSPYILICAIVEADTSFPVEVVTSAVAHCAFYQIAHLTHKIRPFRPTIVSIGGTPRYLERLLRHGYQPIGKFMRGTDKPIVRLMHPKEPSTGPKCSFKAYKLVQIGLLLYRVANGGDWRKEDRILGKQ